MREKEKEREREREESITLPWTTRRVQHTPERMGEDSLSAGEGREERITGCPLGTGQIDTGLLIGLSVLALHMRAL